MLVRSFVTMDFLTKKLGGSSKMSMNVKEKNKVKRRSKNESNNPLSYSSMNNMNNNLSLSLTYFGGL